MKNSRFGELDALRGIAALAVAFYHYTKNSQYLHFGDYKFALGEHGVELFFMISGFVIYNTLERSKTLTDFAFSRASRLYPTYWTALLIWATFDLVVMGNRPWLSVYAVNVTMLQQFFHMPHVDEVAWTLAVELVFYCWMGLLFATKKLKYVNTICVAWLALALVWAEARKAVTLPEALNTYLILQYIPYFIAGISFRRIQRDGWSPQCVAVLLLAMVVANTINGWYLVNAGLFLIFVLAVSGRLTFLNNPMLLWLGSVSYAMYLVHRNMGYDINRILHDHGIPNVVAIPLVVGITLAVASAVTFWVERPVMARLRHWYESRKSITPVTANEAA